MRRRKADFRRLDKVVTEAREQRGLVCHAHLGRVQNRVDELLAEVDGIPAFFFLDPFGLGVDFPTMRTVMRERSGPSTEVLVNFSANAVRRIGGLLDSPPDTKGRTATLEALDRVCGGDWWREVFVQYETNERRVEVIAEGWTDRVRAVVKSGAWCIPVRNRTHGQPVYYLVFFSRHRDGMWYFGDALARPRGTGGATSARRPRRRAPCS